MCPPRYIYLCEVQKSSMLRPSPGSQRALHPYVSV